MRPADDFLSPPPIARAMGRAVLAAADALFPPTPADRYVAKQRRAAARRVAGQLLPRASKAERREEKRARRIRRESLRAEQELREAERRRLDIALMRGTGTGEPVGIAADAATARRATRPSAHRTLAMIAALAALGGRP